MEKIPVWEFDVYALSLPRGHGFGQQPPIGAWATADRRAFGAVTQDDSDGTYGALVMRRRVDRVWMLTSKEEGYASKEAALDRLETNLREHDPPEPLAPNVRARPFLYDLKGRNPDEVFTLLTHPSRRPAAWTLDQLYLALPNPDPNWASDCQTGHFHTRLWEAQLLASFREQGLLVTQPHESPDFHIQNRHGGEAWVEAVTANPPVPYNHVNSLPSSPPEDRTARFFGQSAVRFAKTIGNKIARGYDRLPHVAGKPFMLALADFQAPASMIWSRESLIGYLYGEGAEVAVINGVKRAVPLPASHLQGPTQFPAGLFADGKHSEISAVIFSNAATIAKLNRVGITGLGAPSGYRYYRIGEFFDREPGALVGKPFCLDVASDEYRSLWPQHYEPWCAELEVFHNHYATYPVSHALLPEVTHWFREGNEMVCRSIYETSILWSQTRIQNDTDPPLTLGQLVPDNNPDQ